MGTLRDLQGTLWAFDARTVRSSHAIWRAWESRQFICTARAAFDSRHAGNLPRLKCQCCAETSSRLLHSFGSLYGASPQLNVAGACVGLCKPPTLYSADPASCEHPMMFLDAPPYAYCMPPNSARGLPGFRLGPARRPGALRWIGTIIGTEMSTRSGAPSPSGSCAGRWSRPKDSNWPRWHSDWSLSIKMLMDFTCC